MGKTGNGRSCETEDVTIDQLVSCDDLGHASALLASSSEPCPLSYGEN